MSFQISLAAPPPPPLQPQKKHIREEKKIEKPTIDLKQIIEAGKGLKHVERTLPEETSCTDLLIQDETFQQPLTTVEKINQNIGKFNKIMKQLKEEIYSSEVTIQQGITNLQNAEKRAQNLPCNFKNLTSEQQQNLEKKIKSEQNDLEKRENILNKSQQKLSKIKKTRSKPKKNYRIKNYRIY